MQILENVNPSIPIDQGDVFSGILFPALEANVDAVLITPTCDMVQNKSAFLKFVSTIPSYVVLEAIALGIGIESEKLRSSDPLTPKQLKNLISGLRSNVNGNYLPRYYLFPELKDVFPYSYLDFQRIFVVPYLQVKEEYIDKRIARVISPWKEDIVARYTGYSMRVGTSDYSEDDLKNVITSAGVTIN